jgi:hypothetical protein
MALFTERVLLFRSNCERDIAIVIFVYERKPIIRFAVVWSRVVNVLLSLFARHVRLSAARVFANTLSLRNVTGAPNMALNRHQHNV